jgi:competence protein ComEC
VLFSSAIAGLATAPVGAAHFNTMAHYGLIANLVSVPLMGVLVIPAAVLALCLAPLGLEAVGLVPMGWGLAWILGVAETVSGLEGAQGYVPGPGPWVLPVMALGMLWLILWQGQARLAGVLPVIASFILWAQAERLGVLVAETGGLVGVMTETGRALSKPHGAGFVAKNWLENDGDGSDQAGAAARWPGPTGKLQVITVGETEIVHVIGKTGAALIEICKAGQVVVASVPLRLAGDCELFDSRRLLQTGSLAIGPCGIVTAQQAAGRRIWNTPPAEDRRLAKGQ